MKKWMNLILSGALILSLAACGGTGATTAETKAAGTEAAASVESGTAAAAEAGAAANESTEAAETQDDADAAGTTTAGTDAAAATTKATTASTAGSESGLSVRTNGGDLIPLSSLEHASDSAEAPLVFFTGEITSEALMQAYAALNWTPSGKVAVKLSTGEPPNSNYLDPNLIRELVQSVDGTIVECNTAYGGSRANTAMHRQVAEDHGFTAIAEVDIQDEEGSMSLPVTGGAHLKENLVGSHFANYDSYLVLTHFKGHQMAGFGGAIKNISIGLGSQEGKSLIHTAGKNHDSPWGGVQDDFTESMADAGKSVSDALGNGERIVYINVMNRISIDCDCNGNPAEPDIHDIGILASTDPVALDQACIDLAYVAKGNETLVARIEGQNGLHVLEAGEAIGLGSRTYQLKNLDE